MRSFTGAEGKERLCTVIQRRLDLLAAHGYDYPEKPVCPLLSFFVILSQGMQDDVLSMFIDNAKGQDLSTEVLVWRLILLYTASIGTTVTVSVASVYVLFVSSKTVRCWSTLFMR